MRIEVDLEMCQGYGNCVTAAPEFFDLDDAAQVRLLNDTARTAAEQGAVRAAVPLCPMNAIRVVG